MSRQYERPQAREGGLRLHPEREHGRLLAEESSASSAT